VVGAGVLGADVDATHPALKASMSVVGLVAAAEQSTSAMTLSLVVAMSTVLRPRGLPVGQLGTL
jgi:hypothetical protein